jgi:transcriptional regulator with XRE-family HTH domain
VAYDEEFDEMLHELFSSDHSPELTDSVVDAFLASPAKAPKQSGDRVIILFATRVLADFHKQPIRHVEPQTFATWIQGIRKLARLEIRDIATAVGKDFTYVERLETGLTLPWNLKPEDIACFVRLFRLHMNAMRSLIQKSFDVSSTNTSGAPAARAHRGKMTAERGEATNRALQMLLAHNTTPKPLDNSVGEWLSNVQMQLERWQASELID